jgi:hypothetical protein
MFKFLRRQAGVPVCRRKPGAETEVDYAVSLLCPVSEKVAVFGNTGGAGLRKLPGRFHIAADIIRCNIYAVPTGTVSQGDQNAEKCDIMFFEKLPGQITGAVRCDFHFHGSTFLSGEAVCGSISMPIIFL